LPFVRRELSIIVFLTAVGTAFLLLGLLAIWKATGVLVSLGFDLMIGASLAATLLVVVVFLFVKGPLLNAKERAG
jgi:hypothetical protein